MAHIRYVITWVLGDGVATADTQSNRWEQ